MFMRTVGKGFGKALAILLSVALLCMFGMASAQEDWQLLNLILTWTDEAGTEFQVAAAPVALDSGEQVFWATVPNDSSTYMLSVSHPDHADYTFESSIGNVVAVNAGQEMNREQAVFLTAYDANGNAVDTYTLYISTYAAPQPEAAPLTQDVTARWMLTDGTVLSEQTVTLTEGVPQTFQRLDLDGYEPEANTPESITVTLAGDGSVNPATPVFYYHVKEVAPLTQDVTVRWMLTDGTVLTEQTVTLTEGVPQTFQRLALDGYEPEGNTPESITVTLAGDGSVNPATPVFYYHVKEVAPLTQDVTVRWMLTDGTVLTEQTVTLTEGVPQTFQRLALDGYEPDANTPESITVTLAGDGSINPGMPVFYYHVKEVAPLTQDVTVRWMLKDGTVLTEQTVTLTEGVPQTFQRLALDGYEPDADTPESITVTLAGDGSINPGMPVFYYHVKEAAKLTRDVTVRWMLTDGTVLTEQTVTLTEGVPQSFDRLTLEGYEPEGMTPETITAVLSADGTVIPDPIVFYYHAAIQPPKTAEVTVTYVADQSTVLRTETVTVSEAAPHTFSRLPFEGYEPDADTPESITVTVASDGSVSPQGAVFSYHTYVKPTDVPPVTVPVHYVDAGGNPLAPDQYVTLDAGRSIQLAPDSSLVPGQYDPASAGTITIQVSPDGIASPDEATFVFKHREAEETPIPVGEYINRWAQTTAKGVNIRSTPAKKGNAVKIAKTGTKVYAVQSVLNAQGQNWIKVIYEGKEGYISSEFLEILSQAQSDDYQDTLSTPVPAVTPEYIEPTQAAPTDAPATEPPATELPATATPTVPPTATPVPETYTGYALTQAVVALRDEVSNSDSSIMTKLEKNALVTVKGQVYTESGEAWSQVQTLENLIGFVPDATLRRINAQEADYYIREYQEAHPTPTPKSTATEAPIQITGYAYTIGDNVPFRNTYSDKSVILSQLTQKTAVYVAGQEYNTEDGWPWHMVMYNGTLGYIRSDMLRMMSASETEQYLAGPATAAPTAQITAKPYDPDSSSSYGYIYASNNGAVNMRKTASTKANVVKRLRNYAFCLVLGTQKIDGTTWYRITYDGVTGYVQGSFFKQMSLAELEEFIHSPEYQQGIVNNTSTDPSATAAPIVSQEEQNVNTWTDPNSGLNVTYATWAPFATTAPIITSAPVNTPTPSPTPEGVVVIAVSPSVSPSLAPTAEPIPTVEVEPVEPTRGSSAWVWISLVCLAAGGAGYVMVIRKRNQKRAAERARQRKAQIARQQSTAPAAEKPKTGTYPQQPGQASVRRPYTEVPAPRPTQPQPRNGANAAGQNGYKPVFQENTQPQVKPVNPYEKPTEPMVNKENANAAPVSDTPDVSSTSNGEGTQRTGRRARRRAMEALNENQSNKPEI